MTRVNFQDGWHFRNYFWYNGRMAFESSVCQLHMSIELSSLLAGHRNQVRQDFEITPKQNPYNVELMNETMS